jgi:hypothetical protein
MSETFDGTVDVQDSGALTTVHLDGNFGTVRAGGNGKDGSIVVRNAAEFDVVTITGATTSPTSVNISDGAGNSVIELLDLGRINVRQVIDGENRYLLQLDTGATASVTVGAEDASGVVTVRNTANADVIALDGAEGDIVVHDESGVEVLRFDGSLAALIVGAEGKDGDIIVRDDAGLTTVQVDGNKAALFLGAEGKEGDVFVRDTEGRTVLHLDGDKAALFVGAEGNEGDVIVRDADGRSVIQLDGDKAALRVGASGNEGDVMVYDADGDLRIHLDGASGEVKLVGADCAEDFEVRDAATIEPGTVLVIDEAGGLRRSRTAYDRRVAGVVSGAGGLRPGLVLDKQTEASDRRPVALVGKVYCKVVAAGGPIAVGDLLTTSDTPGHAMRVGDPSRAFGAVIGKALAPLAAGRGLVPILVALQ